MPKPHPAPSVPRHAEALARHELRPRKALGQHFLTSRGALERILAAADLQPEDTVVEVGPGTGVLTRELAGRVRRVIAIEKDEALADGLRRELASERVAIVTGDMLELDPAALLAEHGGSAAYKVVANLPYYAANPILRRFLECSARPALLVLLLQREVAESIAAKPGAMRILSVAVQRYAEPGIVGIVKPGSFYPPPKVESAIVRLAVRPAPLLAPDTETDALMALVRAGFSAPRKQIAGPLARGLGISREAALAALAAAGTDPRRRAETLALEEWGKLYQALKRLTPHPPSPPGKGATRLQRQRRHRPGRGRLS